MKISLTQLIARQNTELSSAYTAHLPAAQLNAMIARHSDERRACTTLIIPMKTTSKLIEISQRHGAYDLGCSAAIIDSRKHGRLLLHQGFGGMDSLAGGSYRWRHGIVARLQPADTLASLAEENWNDHMSRLDAILEACDPTRPVLNFRGAAIAALARQAGL